MHLALFLSYIHAATITNSTAATLDHQLEVGVPSRPFGIPNDFSVQVDDEGWGTTPMEILLLNTMNAIENICLRGYFSPVENFRLRDPSVTSRDILYFDVIEPDQPGSAFEARYVLWGLYLCALDFVGQRVDYCVFVMPGIGQGLLTYGQVHLSTGTSLQSANASDTAKRTMIARQMSDRSLASNISPALANSTSDSITFTGPFAHIRIYNRGVIPEPRNTVFYAFYQAMIARTSISYPAPIPSWSYNMIGLGPINIHYQASRTPGAAQADLATIIHGLAEIPRLMLFSGKFAECDFDIYGDGGDEVVASGSFRRTSLGQTTASVQLTG